MSVRFRMRVYFDCPDKGYPSDYRNLVAIGTIDGPECCDGLDYFSSEDMYWPEGKDNLTLTVKGKTILTLLETGFQFVNPL